MHLDRLTVVSFVALVVAIIFHEVSHGVVALFFGDDTARRAGRLTLNPLPHVDPLGSVILPAMGAIVGVPVIGWAKPVPVNPQRLRNPRRDMLVVSLAGPSTNFLLAAIAALGARALYPHGTSSLPFEFAYQFARLNIFLGVFNFLPIPPLDGSALVERALPREWLPGWQQYRQYGILILFVLVLSTNVLGRLFAPFDHRLYAFVTG